MLVWAETHVPHKLQNKKSGLFFLIGAEQYECRNNGDLILNVTEYHFQNCDVECTITGKLFSSIDREIKEREREGQERYQACLVLLDTSQSIITVPPLDLPFMNTLDSRRMRISILKLLGAGVELEEVISHRQLVAKLSNLEENRRIT